jgi:superfamily II DNA or RNA helicase
MNKLKDGFDYEEYILNIIKDKYKSCYLWKDIPINILDLNFYKNYKICDDIGCDIIGIHNNDSIDYIQCKNYSTTGENNTINICDLAGFYNFVAENSIQSGIVYFSGKLSQQILCRKNKINYINVPLIKKNEILNFKPRDYQLEAYNKLKESNKSILSMPCGTGKTFVSFLMSLEYKNIFILTPLISTTEQILSHYKNYYSSYKEINYVSVNCNGERNIDNIKLNENKNIIASTYDSSDILWKLLKETYIEDNLIIIDEFHNLSQDMITNKDNYMNKIIRSKCKTIYISATPLLVADYENIFGNNKYELSWDTAIKNKYICDYNFYYPNNDKIIERTDELKIDKTLIEKTILINKSYFLLESIKLTNVKKCITYLKSIKESEEFVKILKTINIYFNLNIKVYEINYNTTKKKRNEYLNKFKNDNSSINIICNVHILDEGVDIPECDSVYLTHPNNNPINIIQRISRANRLDQLNKDKIAKIFIWSKDKIKLENIMKNISKTINIKYGNECNEFVNRIEINKINKVYSQNTIIYGDNIIKCYKTIEPNIDENFIVFINTFFKKFQIGDDLNFDIEDSDVSKYLDITLKNLRQRLSNEYSKTKRFIENVDFIKIKTGKKSGVTYMLNYACFEKIAMSGDSVKSEAVRMYFIKLRQFIVENQKLIYQAMENKMDLNKFNGYESIYFFVIDERTPDILKAGRTKDIVNRLRNYNVGRIKEVELKYFALVRNSLLIEKCLKFKLKKNQVLENTEIFKVDPKILKKVIKECYCKYVSSKENEELYKEISDLLGLYAYTKDKKYIKPYIIIDK